MLSRGCAGLGAFTYGGPIGDRNWPCIRMPKLVGPEELATDRGRSLTLSKFSSDSSPLMLESPILVSLAVFLAIIRRDRLLLAVSVLKVEELERLGYFNF